MRNRVIFFALVIAALAFPKAHGDDKPVVHYDFAEGAGPTLHDKSGNGNDGAVHGATWAASEGLPALALDGVDDYVDCGDGKGTDITDTISVEVWACPEKMPPSGEAGIVGKSFASYGLTHYGDGCWWYISGGGNNCKTPFSVGTWHHIVGTFDGATMKLYMDGVLRDSHPSKARTIGHGKNLLIGISAGEAEYTKNAHFNGMIGEVRIYNRALSAEEVLNHYRTTRLTHRIDLKTDIRFFSREVTATMNFRGLGELPPKAIAEVELLTTGGTQRLQKCTVRNVSAWGTATATLPSADLKPGDYELRVKVVDQAGNQVGETSVAKMTWPAAPSWPGLARGKVLNNFVTELLNVAPVTLKEYVFTHPRDGWVFISSTTEPGVGASILLDDAAVIVHENGKPQTLESMRRLQKGEHKITVRCEGLPALKSLIVRAIPEIVYCQFQSNPHVKEYGPYDYGFLKKDVLPNVNCIVGNRDPGKRPYPLQAFVEQWKREGKKWIVECGVPGLGGKEPINADKAYAYWSGNVGFQNPLMDGVIADEFGAGEQEQYLAWMEAVRRISQDPKFRGKELIPYCGPMYGAKRSEAFIRTVLGAGYKFAFERYLKEQPTEAEASSFIETSLRSAMLGWREALPGSERQAIMCLGYMCQPPESLNTDPGVDYKVYMDMQFNCIANDLSFWGLYGIMEYLSSYADEETVRWAGRLYRHYCIEGKTERLSIDPYKLDHIENPDFVEGLHAWTLSPAEEGSITSAAFSGYGWLEGRYPKTNEGDAFLCTRRCAARSNMFSQEIKGLEPGRLYSLKMYTGDRKELVAGKSAQQKHAISIKLEGVEIIPGKSFQHVFPNCYSHHLGPFDNKNPLWMNYYWRVFRATGARARLTISDWASNTDPGGPVGQELMFNFVEIQPYYE